MKKRTRRVPGNPKHYVDILHRRGGGDKERHDMPLHNHPATTEVMAEKTEEDLEFSDYGIARVIAKIIAFMGWLTFVLGFVVVGYAAVHADGTKNLDVILVIVLPGIGMIITGLFLIVSGQITRATVDNASHTKYILLHLRRHSRTP